MMKRVTEALSFTGWCWASRMIRVKPARDSRRRA